MANQVTFQIKIETVGAENVKNVTMDAEELGRVVKEVTDEQQKLNTKLLDINQAQQAIQNIVSGIGQIASEIKGYTQAYAMQETVEAKVAQVMRNTMDASEAEIESIKNLCAAQQELGVIGDEVQMAGAQELATYLEKKSSLEKLIPVMNDMLAQQYGLEASQESAATIATMLGKVMEGQTQALSRYGYSFDETQEKILKFGTEEERAAVLAEVVSQSVGGMNQALAQTDSGKAKQLANTIGDLKEQVGACLSRIEPTVSALAEFGMAAQGMMSVVQGARGMAAAFSSLNLVQRAHNAVTAITTTLTNTLAAAMGGGAVAARVLSVAIRGLMIATGVGMAIAALTFAIEVFSSSSKKATDAAEVFASAQSDEAAQLQQTRAALEINIAKLKDFHGSKEQEKKIVEEMNNTYGETMGYFSSVAEWYNALIKNSDAYCRQMVIEARTRMLANQIAEKEQKIHDLKYDETGKARQYSKQREKKTVAHVEDTGLYGEGNVTYERIEVEGTSDLEKATAAYNAERQAVAGLQKQLRDLVKESATIELPVVGSSTRPTGGNSGGTSGANDKKAPAAEGSINRYKELLAELRKQIEETGNADLAANLQKQYEALEAEFKAHKIKIGLEKPEPKETKTYIDSLREQLAAAQKSFDNATTVEARVEAITKVDEIQKQIDEATHGKVTIEAEAEVSYIQPGGKADQRQSYANAQAKASRIQQDYEIGLIGKEEAEKGIADINAALAKLNPNLKGLKLKVDTSALDQAKKKFDFAIQSTKELGASLAGLGSAIGVPELNIAGVMAQAIATMVGGYATATAQAGTMGPWAWIAFAALGLAQLTAMITSVKDVAKFADGGVAYGPTLGLFGEYANAATNPEVVAPLDKLRGILGVEGDGGKVDIKLRMRGRDLVGVSSKRTKLVRRS